MGRFRESDLESGVGLVGCTFLKFNFFPRKRLMERVTDLESGVGLELLGVQERDHALRVHLALQARVLVHLMIDSGLVGSTDTTRAEDAQGTPTQSHTTRSILVYEADI